MDVLFLIGSGVIVAYCIFLSPSPHIPAPQRYPLNHQENLSRKTSPGGGAAAIFPHHHPHAKDTLTQCLSD